MKLNDDQSAILFTAKENGMVDMEVIGVDGVARDEALYHYQTIAGTEQDTVNDIILACADENVEN